MTSKFKVRVEGLLPPNAIMAITGNSEELGFWRPQLCLPMECISKTSDAEVWYKELHLKQIIGKLEFRYAMVEVEDVNNERLVKILKWETRLKPRSYYIQDLISRNEPEVHYFGKYDGETMLQRGWLTGQTEVQLRVYEDSFKWFKPRHRGRRAYLRVHQLRCLEDTSGYESMDHLPRLEDDETTDSVNALPTITMATVSRLGSNTEPFVPDLNRFQGAIRHTDTDYHTFRLQAWDIDCMCIEIEVLIGSRLDNNEEEEPRLVGTARLAQFERLQGVKWLHVYGNNRRVIGQVKVDFLVIYPLRDVQQTMEVSYAKYWRFIRTLTFGHRGSGSDVDHHDTGTNPKENTLNSLRSAFEHGADYVEFDVHLSKDKIPVVYHDFAVALTLRKKKRGDLRYVKVAVKDLTMDELQNLKVSHTAVLESEHSQQHLDAEQSDVLESLVFLSLAQVFDHFDHDDNKMGFNIEIKYPQHLANGEHEQENYFERNEFLDIILKLILTMAGKRRILLSSFDADICTMINLKQNRYPVVFLSQGINSKYPDYFDIRTHSHSMAIQHAVDTGILGVNLYCEELLRDIQTILSMARRMRLVVITWGEELNKNHIQEQLKALHIDGLVFDRIHEHHQKGHLNVFRSTTPGAWPTANVLSNLGFNFCSSESAVSLSEHLSISPSSSISDGDCAAPSRAKLAKTSDSQPS